MDEVNGIPALKVPSTILVKPELDEEEIDNVTEIIPPPSLEDMV